MTKGTLFLTYEPNDLKLVGGLVLFSVFGRRKRSKLNLKEKMSMQQVIQTIITCLMERFSSSPGCLDI